ncbi:hypothetical protein QBC35DRAFT_388147 [Podospora australis]|uniref:Uncharacterized protein n=1 Tax=Podospora australis TaxID=1536484 RepID=A0AAN6WQW0_9PEZI|nr:hypothetical protein QBC35DRAFT_388147 [Podospora australis]
MVSNVTQESDAPRALGGIIRRHSLRLDGYQMLEGVPTDAFDPFILFRGRNLGRRRGFPSRSWAGWRGKVYFHAVGSIPHDGLNSWLASHTWIIWYKRNQVSGVLDLVWDSTANQSFPVHDPKYVAYRQRTPFRCPVEELDTSNAVPSKLDLLISTILASSQPRTCPLLEFWTLSVYLKLHSIDTIQGSGKLMGADGGKYGYMLLDGFEETTFFESEDPYELLELNFREEFGPEFLGGHPCYSVMLIEWHQGVAERRGIGHVVKTEVQSSFAPGPTWKGIILG